MRAITVTTDVFAAIWARRNTGEENENDILRRLLVEKSTVEGDEVQTPITRLSGGVHIPQYGVRFAEGEEIFRVYKGVEYRARASNGKWLLLSTGQAYPSLHKLSTAVVAGPENSWLNWRCRRNGLEALLDSLRGASST